MSHQKSNRSRLEFVLWLSLAIAFLVASYVIFHEYRFSLNTDGAAEDILAKLAVDESRLIPTNWTYANGDLWVLGPRLFLVALFPFLGMGYLLHASATWLSYLYLLVMVYATCRVLSPSSRRAAIIGTTIAAGCLSTLNFEFVVGQGAYSLYAALALALFAMASHDRASEPIGGRDVSTWLLAAFAAAMVCISNATRGGITVIAPLLAGWAVANILRRDRTWRERAKLFNNGAVIAVILGAIAGTLLYRLWLLPGVVNSSGAAGFQLASASEMLRRLFALPAGWFAYFRIGADWGSLSLIQRVAQSLAWLTSLWLLLAPILVVANAKHCARALVSLSWIAMACYAVTIAALVSSRYLFDGPASLRYATFGIYASVCVGATLITNMMGWHFKTFSTIAILLCVASITTISVWREEWTPGGITYVQRMNLVRSLELHGVDVALTTYWNSEVLTVLSRGKVNVLPIDVSASAEITRHGQNSPIVVSRAHGKQAIALTSDEATEVVWQKLTQELGDPAERYRSGPFNVNVYNHDVARLFYGAHAAIDVAIPSDQLMVRLSKTELPLCRSAQGCDVAIEATNVGAHALASAGTKPIRLGIHGLDARGNIIEQDAGRANFVFPLYSGASERIIVNLRPTKNPLIVRYQLCLLQELVAWHCNRTVAPRTQRSH